jgi:general secretion pathway protein I
MNKGFTLIECLVALLIVAVVLASASRALGMIIHDVHDSYVREVATWIAENEYNDYNIRSVYPEIGVKNEKIKFAGVDFNVTEKVVQTANPYFRRIEISISEAEEPKHAIFKTVNFIAQY